MEMLEIKILNIHMSHNSNNLKKLSLTILRWLKNIKKNSYKKFKIKTKISLLV